MSLVALSAFMFGLIVLADHFLKKRGLLLVAWTSMLFIVMFPLFGVDFFDFLVNVGNIFYVTVLGCLALMYLKYGSGDAWMFLNAIFFGLIAYTATVFLLGSIPVLSGNEVARDIYSNILSLTPQIVTASFLALYIVQSFFIKMSDWIKTKYVFLRTGVLLILCQIFDSLIFFPFAFYGVFPQETVINLIIGGVVFKTLLTIASLPFIRFAILNKIV